MRQNSGLAHCIKSNRHWDYCGNYQEMVEYIKINESEIKKELHLKLFKLIPNKLVPGREYKEWKAYKKAGETLNKALQSCIMAREAYDKAKVACKKRGESLVNLLRAWDAYYSKYANELQILHDKMFPDCPWDGESIF